MSEKEKKNEHDLFLERWPQAPDLESTFGDFLQPVKPSNFQLQIRAMLCHATLFLMKRLDLLSMCSKVNEVVKRRSTSVAQQGLCLAEVPKLLS